MKPVRIAILLLLFFIIAGVAGWRLQYFFLQNKATFLLNQRDFDKASRLIRKLEQKNPENLETDLLQIKALTLTGDYRAAAQIDVNSELVASKPELLYWRAVAAYQQGHTELAKSFAQRFIESKDELPAGSMSVARALAGESSILEVPDKQTRSFQMLFTVEQAVYLGLAGLQQMELGRLNTAAELLRRSFMLGNRNSKFLVRGAKALALLGEVQAARMFLDHSGAANVEPLFYDLQQIYRDFQVLSLTLNSDDLARGGRKIDVARALAWSAIMFLEQNVSGHRSQVISLVDELLAEFPYDPVLQVRRAAILEIVKEYSAAYAIYQLVQEKHPNYTVLVRMSAIEGVSESELSRRSNEFMELLDPISSLSVGQLMVKNGIQRNGYIAFHTAGAAKGNLQVDDRGSYMITVVAKGDKAAGKWPLIKVYIDDELAGMLYVCRENWDCFTLATPLEAGAHTIKVVYENDKVDSEESLENRSFYLRSINVTVTGVADVG